MRRRQRAATKNKPEAKKNELRYSLYKIRFLVQNDRKHGVAVMDLTQKRSTYDTQEIEVRLPIVSLWRDAGHNTACKCHLQADVRKADHRLLMQAMSQQSLACDDLYFTVERSLGIIRGGAKSGDQYTNYDRSTYKNVIIYDSKAAALADLLEAIGSHVQISGANLVNLACVPDEALLEIGYERVSDLFGKGADMWTGDHHEMLRACDKNAGGYSWEAADKNSRSFLKIISQYL